MSLISSTRSRVAYILADMRLDEITVTAGILHDTIEDTLATPEEFRSGSFGDEVAFLVEGVTKISRVEFTSARERQAENFRKMLLAMSKDIRILLIKLADRLHNMRTLGFMKEDPRRRVAQETLEIYRVAGASPRYPSGEAGTRSARLPGAVSERGGDARTRAYDQSARARALHRRGDRHLLGEARRSEICTPT